MVDTEVVLRRGGVVIADRARWPAVVDDEWNLPTAEHVLDWLVRHHLLDGLSDPLEIAAAVEFNPRLGIVAFPPGNELPACDICRMNGRKGVARFDAGVPQRGGAWAFLCEDCFLAHTSGYLGLGVGQYLMLYNEIDADVRRAFQRCKEYWVQLGVSPTYMGDPFHHEPDEQ